MLFNFNDCAIICTSQQGGSMSNLAGQLGLSVWSLQRKRLFALFYCSVSAGISKSS